jgi:Glycosyl hydrolase family 63 C-terminal domain
MAVSKAGTEQKGTTAEEDRLAADARREANWKRWGPYLSERQWGTVREDYSADGNSWDYLPHDHARSRAYRWGEDGLLGISDRECRLCFALALWNGRDPILKERLFGLSGNEGNHGEDVKEQYFYIDSTPTHSYMKALYKYPQCEFPYRSLVEINEQRTRFDPEFELADTGAFAKDRYFDVFAEYAKAGQDDILIRLTVANRGPAAAPLHLLPTLWFRNTWSWGVLEQNDQTHPRLTGEGPTAILAEHETLGNFRLTADLHPQGAGCNGGMAAPQLFTENNTNCRRLFNSANDVPFVKDAFHERVIHGNTEAVNCDPVGTKAAFWYQLEIPAGQQAEIRLRLCTVANDPLRPLGPEFEAVFAQRIAEANAFYDAKILAVNDNEKTVARQAYAGLLWSKQFYYYVVHRWLVGDPAQPPPPRSRKKGRNHNWRHMFARDVLSMPDKWEYPWFAAWDLAFHMIPFATIDPEFAKDQLVLLLREWYMHANGQQPAYEWAFGDVNPPVHAWACWRVYKITGKDGKRDRLFLERCFQKLMINFTWWVNRKDIGGKQIFGGGFLGLDNIGIFDRNKPLPNGDRLEQADGTAWMAFYCGTMLSMALELATVDPSYEDVASKFFEHFIAIVEAMNSLGGTGLWDEQDGFYYDQLTGDGHVIPMRVRSLVGIIPLLAVEILEKDVIDRLPGFSKRMRWFLKHRQDLQHYISYMEEEPAEPDYPDHAHNSHYLLALPSRQRLERVLRYVLDESEFLSPHGLRSLSRCYKDHPYSFTVGNDQLGIHYTAAESDTTLFGGNSNWRGPVWMPINFLLVEALERYQYFYRDSFRVECPTGSGNMLTLGEVAQELTRRLISLFLPDETGRRPCNGAGGLFDSKHFRDLVLFNEYFDGDNGRGLGATHQTGWTALVARLVQDHCRDAMASSSQAVPATP